MRPIKFRGKCIEGAETSHEAVQKGSWVEGFLCREHPDSWFIAVDLCAECGGVGSGIVTVHVLVNPKTVGQFTGLKDQNGKEIYEGDIVRFTKQSSVITLGDSYSEAGKRIVSVSDETRQLGWHGSGYSFCKANCENIVEILGNIHDNPELLEEPANA